MIKWLASAGPKMVLEWLISAVQVLEWLISAVSTAPGYLCV